MERIAASTGSKRRTRPRTAPSKVRSGRHHKSISETGATTARRASAFSSTPTEISTKACGPSISATDRERTGRTRAQSYAVSTRVIGTKIRSTVEEHSSTKMAIVTMAIGSTDFPKAKAA